jgi:hypothetical protein
MSIISMDQRLPGYEVGTTILSILIKYNTDK